ncbi:MAG TPA: PKD domain-containing protein [Flavipsychrobacter sp.]|nr:PKD domain-containing protein [Flavipsychrobacter sp.]
MRHALSFLLTMFANYLFADTTSVSLKISSPCPIIQNLPDTIYTCNPTVQLNPTLTSSGGVITVDTTWTPSIGLSNPNTINPIVTVGTSAQVYKLTIQALSTTNLVINGDFSSGNTGFTSNYSVGQGGAFGPLSSEGQYVIINNAAAAHNLFASFGDHTTGTGQMMVVNGASVPNINVWCQNINIQPNTWYDFSAWVATPYPNNPAILQFSVNGSLLGQPFNAPNSLGNWSPFQVSWFSGNSTIATICITNQNTALDGNDFALDDIQFREICFVSDSIYIVPGSVNAFFSSPDTICVDKSITFTSAYNDPSSSYYWSFGDGFSSSNYSTQHSYVTPGLYTITHVLYNSPTCKDTFQKQIFVREPYEFYKSAIICKGSSVILGNQTITDSGRYMYTFQTSGACDSTVHLEVAVAETPHVNFTFTSVLNMPVKFTNHSTNATSFLWNFGDSATSTEVHPTHQYKRSGNFKVCLTGWSAEGCKQVVCKTVSVEVIIAIDVPTAFSPNADGVNDVLFVRGGGIERICFRIYNRWGQQIFETNNLSEGWDGTYKGTPVDIETVAFVLQATFIDGNTITKQGNITLIR